MNRLRDNNQERGISPILLRIKGFPAPFIDIGAQMSIIWQISLDKKMLIDIDKITKGGLKVSRDFDFPSLDLIEEEAVFLKPVHAEMTLTRMDDEVWIKGRITACLSFVCGRCLASYEFRVDSKFDLIYLPEEYHDLKDELDDEDVDQLFYQNRQIDVREVILEQLNLTFPAKPLCSETCEGICAVCGKIRKDGNCGCQVKETDHRMEKLKIFVKDKR